MGWHERSRNREDGTSDEAGRNRPGREVTNNRRIEEGGCHTSNVHMVGASIRSNGGHSRTCGANSERSDVAGESPSLDPFRVGAAARQNPRELWRCVKLGLGKAFTLVAFGSPPYGEIRWVQPVFGQCLAMVTSLRLASLKRVTLPVKKTTRRDHWLLTFCLQ
ncbi:hypothetical protein R1flu_023436 [Riccia fluitans]|uniref:Uncharacterized protein n=1 Tax=Riccia fluitans TaxID=41844 RepID=A0ABD1XSJ7_9MARC